MKKLAISAFIIIGIFVAIYIGKNTIIKIVVSTSIKAITGLGLDIEKVNMGVFNTLIDIKNLKLFNPPNFPDKLMVDMPELYIDYDLGSFFKGKIHIQRMRLNLKEFVVVRNEKRELNLDSLKMIEAGKEKKTGPEKEKEKAPEIAVDLLELKIGKAIYKDYSRGTPPRVREFNVNIDERFENITNLYALGSVIVVKALQNTAIASLTNFDVGLLMNNAKDVLGQASKTAIEAAAKGYEKSKEISSKAKDGAGKVVEKLSETIKGILPVGK